jgi:hypothetical protein
MALLAGPCVEAREGRKANAYVDVTGLAVESALFLGRPEREQHWNGAVQGDSGIVTARTRQGWAGDAAPRLDPSGPSSE